MKRTLSWESKGVPWPCDAKFLPMTHNRGVYSEEWWYNHSCFRPFWRNAKKMKTLQMHRLGKSKKHL